MTSYTEPDFEALVIGLDHIPEQSELFPGDDTIWLGQYDAEIHLIGTRKRYKVGVAFYEAEAPEVIRVWIWTRSEIAGRKTREHLKIDSSIKVTIGAVRFSARITQVYPALRND